MKPKATSLFAEISDVLDEKNFLVKINRPITPDFADVCVEAIHALARKSKLINVLIDGDYNGYSNDTIRIVKALGVYNIRPDYCVTGYAKKAFGCHFIILIGCKIPIGFPHSRFRLARLKADPRFYKELTEKDKSSEKSIFTFIAEISGNSLESIYEMADRQTVLTSKEALERNFLGFIQKSPPSYIT